MAQPVIQTSFNAGEWAPALNARVDLQKYHSGAALLRNFFVDYRGGATTSPGSKYICTTKGSGQVRLIPFQAAFTISYVLEFGNGYVRFLSNGAQVISAGVPYEIASPYTTAELAQLKFTQNVNVMIICHPNHPPYELTLISATNWTINAITFGSTTATPAGLAVASTLGGGTVSYAYIITSVDSIGQESAPSAFATLGARLDIRTTPGTNTVSWLTVAGAVSYNVYKAQPSYAGAIPAGSAFGFIGNVTGLSLIDSNIAPDYSQGPPQVRDPFSGSGVQSVSVTAAGNYTGLTFPTVSFTASPGVTATGIAAIKATAVAIAAAGFGYAVFDTITTSFGVVIQVISVNPGGVINAVSLISPGSVTSGSIPPNPYGVVSTSGGGSGATFNITFGVVSVGITSPGSGYLLTPAVAFSTGAAAATATLGAGSVGNPTVPAFFQQRLVLAGPINSPQQFNISQTGAYYNFNVNIPLEADDAIQGTLISGQLSQIQSMLAQPQGLIVLSDKLAWLLNGGSPGSAVTPSSIVANPQAYNGAAAPPPIVASDNILYVQSKNSIIRDLVFNFYTQVYTGTDISVLSSHLFYGYQILEWAWAEEPFKLVWAVRNDGVMLTLTFLKEQELIAWAHRDTNGLYQSVASVTETVSVGVIDAVYTVVQRIINGVTVRYIERFAELSFPNGATDAWQVDSGIVYNGAPTLNFSGATHLVNTAVTGLATDDLGNVTVINLTVSGTGTFSLVAPTAPATGYTRVLVGLAYTPQLKTLALDLGEPTVQGKRKKISGVTTRVMNTLGLSIGRTFDASSQKLMKDLQLGNVGTMTNEVVSGLITGDARTIIDPLWDVPGQYCIQQNYPYPASILGVIPEIVVGDTK